MDLTKPLRAVMRRASPEERKQIIEEISESAAPGFDFLLMVVLSCSIATLGLVTDSPAVIIGAMLVAPLMSPIIAIGLASITGRAALARNAASALLRGALLAVLLATVMTFVNRHLPFVVLQELPNEVLARTHPSPIDLVIAMAGGLAAAYAMTRRNLSAALPGVAIATALMPPLCTIGIGIALDRWDVAGGATLLFVTNAITIAFAAALVFFVRGFSPNAARQGWRLPRPLVFSAVLTLVLFVPLSYFSVRFFQEATRNREINSVVRSEIARMNGSELVELSVAGAPPAPLDIVVTIRSGNPLTYQQVVELQKRIVAILQRPVSLKVNQIFAEQLDPLVPPTATPTQRLTATPSPSPTLTLSPTASPTNTLTPTPTPVLARVVVTPIPALRLYQSPGGPVIGPLRIGQTLTVLYGKQDYAGMPWVQVIDGDGRIGWIPEMYIRSELPVGLGTPPVTGTP